MNFPPMDGLRVELERLMVVPNLPLDGQQSLAIAYFLRFHNGSGQRLQILARKWVLRSDDGEVLVVEGDGVVGKTPVLEPGEEFAYSSHHEIRQSTLAFGTFFGRNESGEAFRCELKPFRLELGPGPV